VARRIWAADDRLRNVFLQLGVAPHSDQAIPYAAGYMGRACAALAAMRIGGSRSGRVYSWAFSTRLGEQKEYQYLGPCGCR
jgi:hypothetical protein